MVLGNKNENNSGIGNNNIRLSVSSIFSSSILSLENFCEKCIIKLSEIKYKILKIEKESIDEKVKESIEINISDLHKKYELYKIRKVTYLTYHERNNLIEICKSCLNTCAFFKNRSKLLNEPSNDFIKKSLTELSDLLNGFESYNNEGFIQERIQRYDYLFQKSPFFLWIAHRKEL